MYSSTPGIGEKYFRPGCNKSAATPTNPLTACSIVAAATLGSVAHAADNPFAAKQLQAGYQLAQADKKTDGKCGEAKCGADKKDAADKKAAGDKKSDGKCGADKKGDASCGAKK